MNDVTRKFLRFAQRYSIDAVLEAAVTLMAQAAMRRAYSKEEALQVFDRIASLGREAIINNWDLCAAERGRETIN